MTEPTIRRYARHYSDGSFNIGRGGDDEATAIRRLSGSSDDDDTQLVEVEIRVIRSLGAPKLRVVEDIPMRGLVFIEDDGTVRLPTSRDI